MELKVGDEVVWDRSGAENPKRVPIVWLPPISDIIYGESVALIMDGNEPKLVPQRVLKPKPARCSTKMAIFGNALVVWQCTHLEGHNGNHSAIVPFKIWDYTYTTPSGWKEIETEIHWR